MLLMVLSTAARKARSPRNALGGTRRPHFPKAGPLDDRVAIQCMACSPISAIIPMPLDTNQARIIVGDYRFLKGRASIFARAGRSAARRRPARTEQAALDRGRSEDRSGERRRRRREIADAGRQGLRPAGERQH